MQENELFVILNPHADKGRAKKQERMIQTLLSSEGAKVILTYTKAGGGAQNLAYEAAMAGRNPIIAAGGDGTVNEVANGILKAVTKEGIRCPVMGVIPIGRGNDFAWGMGIPKDVTKACSTILAGRTRTIDVGVTYGGNNPEGRFFVNGQGVGFEPLVNFLASDFKHVTGTLSYVLALIRILINYPAPYSVKLTLDDEVINLKTQQLSICNGRRMGSAFLMGPDAIFDDGYFDVVYANTPVQSYKLVPIALTFFKGTQVKLKQFSVKRVKYVKMTSSDNLMPIHVDGEEISLGCMDFTTQLLASALPVFC